MYIYIPTVTKDLLKVKEGSRTVHSRAGKFYLNLEHKTAINQTGGGVSQYFEKTVDNTNAIKHLYGDVADKVVEEVVAQFATKETPVLCSFTIGVRHYTKEWITEVTEDMVIMSVYNTSTGAILNTAREMELYFNQKLSK